MSLQNLCAQRELFLAQYADMEKPIQTLRELCKDNNEKLEIIESFDKYMRQKYEIFADLQDIDNKRQKIDELNRQIHYAVCAILQNIKKESQTTKDTLEMTIRYLRELQIRYDTQEFIESLKGVGKYVGKHLSLLIWIPIVIGALILMFYFAFNAQYLPTISKDSVLYYAFATTILGVFIAFVMGIFFLYPIYAIHLIFYDKPRLEKWASMAFGVIAILPTFGLFVFILLYLFDIQLNYSLFALVLCLIPCVLLMYYFGFKNIILLVILYFMLMLNYLMIVSWIIAFDPTMEPKDFIGLSVLIVLLFAFCVGALASTHFNLVKLSFLIGILCLVVIPFLLSSFIVSKFHIGNYTAKELIFTQEAEKSIAPCQPTYNANNTLAISNVKVISSLGEYILFECNGIEGRRKVPMRFLVGEMLQSNADKDKK
ncbi:MULTISPECIES: MFS transporter [Helicobacter]|uniref:Uncharacterized protein n=1 Tax=Helicobacter bilis ATCC 43879 TaxID=613026 RepID=C3XGW7_9HELI|nr:MULTISPECIES: MFS transporter [Helicobacter]EEO24256.2 hypothetical protein HRAG_01313 [Helicobacter bilis ATCC 43879]